METMIWVIRIQELIILPALMGNSGKMFSKRNKTCDKARSKCELHELKQLFHFIAHCVERKLAKICAGVYSKELYLSLTLEDSVSGRKSFIPNSFQRLISRYMCPLNFRKIKTWGEILEKRVDQSEKIEQRLREKCELPELKRLFQFFWLALH